MGKFTSIYGQEDKKLLKNIGFLLLLGLIFYALDFLIYNWGKWDSIKLSSFFQELLQAVGQTCFVAILVIIFIEIRFRKEFVDDIASIFHEQQPVELLKSSYPKRKEYDLRFSESIAFSKHGECFDMIGISQKTIFNDFPGINVIAEKIAMGVHFRIIIMHPQSPILKCTENLSKDFGFHNLHQSLEDTFGRIQSLIQICSNAGQPILGSLEIRMYNQIQSAICYHANRDDIIIGIYYSHIGGTDCPAFELKEKSMIADARKHFETLWKKCSEEMLIKLNQTDKINKIGNFYA